MKLRLVLALGALALSGGAQNPLSLPRSVIDPGVVTTRQAITPAGVLSVFEGRVYGVTFGSSTSELWVSAADEIVQLDWNANRVLGRTAYSGGAGLQGISYDAPRRRALASLAVSKEGQPLDVQLWGVSGGSHNVIAQGLGTEIAGAVGTNGKLAVVPLIYDNKIALVDLATNQLVRLIPTEIAPFAAVINKAGTVAYVSNWGGRLPLPGEDTAPTGMKPGADQVVVDERGIAKSGTLLRIDLANGDGKKQVAVGLHPTALAWDESRNRLYAANTNQDSVTVVDTETERTSLIELKPFEQPVKGIAATALAVSPDGSKLYVACGGINAIGVFDVTRTPRALGWIPTAWYPDSVAVSPDGAYLAVGALLGVGSGWKGGAARHAPQYGLEPPDFGDSQDRRYVHSYRGTVSVIPVPDQAQLDSYTTAVAENSRMPLKSEPPASRRNVAPKAIPVRSGEPSLIEHVVYIIKENRTYDQVFGDVERGNGDASLVLFDKDVTPNQRALANQYVLLDNIYATGGNSGDGHQWVTQANETAYCLWPGYRGRSYPFDGSDPIAYSEGGFIWDLADKFGKTVKVYGEYAGRISVSKEERLKLLERWRNGDDFSNEFQTVAPIKNLNRFLAPNYPPYATGVPDVVRARIFLNDFKKWEEAGEMPNLVILQLPCDHTAGLSPGWTTMQAMVADNDYAVGQIVEALSKSKFWPKTAIFVIEDDAQNGVDHVDGHRMPALAVSPYSRRGIVDSTFYSQPSVLKTIELILGLPTLSLFDMIANDMRNSFTDKPDLTPYKAIKPKQDLLALNPPVSALSGLALQAALDSARMNWSVPDAVPTDRLNAITWGAIKGWDRPYPEPKHAVFAPLSIDLDDDERELEEEDDDADGDGPQAR